MTMNNKDGTDKKASPLSLLEEEVKSSSMLQQQQSPIRVQQQPQQQVEWVQLLTMTRPPLQKTASAATAGMTSDSVAQTLLSSQPGFLQQQHFFVWTYTSFVGTLLGLWVLYLILPKGLRFHYCRAYRRRYARSEVSLSTRRTIQSHRSQDRRRTRIPNRDYFAGLEQQQQRRRRRRRYAMDDDAREEADIHGKNHRYQRYRYNDGDDDGPSSASSSIDRPHTATNSSTTARDPSPSASGRSSSIMGSSVYSSGQDKYSLHQKQQHQRREGGLDKYDDDDTGGAGTIPTWDETTESSINSSNLHPHHSRDDATSIISKSVTSWSFQTPRTTGTTATYTMDSPSAATSAPATDASSWAWSGGRDSTTATSSSSISHFPSHSVATKSRPPPSETIVTETMTRLRQRGIRLIAHGVQCEPKRVWIKLDEGSLTWQTEFPRRIPNSSGDVSLVLMRGSLHKIALVNILYVDVGKKTSALLNMMQEEHVADGMCFSLLTQNGSLDLQTNSTLERDALVVCFSRVLDTIHGSDYDWRAIYEESPAPSSYVTGASGISVDPYPSDVVMI